MTGDPLVIVCVDIVIVGVVFSEVIRGYCANPQLPVVIKLSCGPPREGMLCLVITERIVVNSQNDKYHHLVLISVRVRACSVMINVWKPIVNSILQIKRASLYEFTFNLINLHNDLCGVYYSWSEELQVSVYTVEPVIDYSYLTDLPVTTSEQHTLILFYCNFGPPSATLGSDSFFIAGWSLSSQHVIYVNHHLYTRQEAAYF